MVAIPQNELDQHRGRGCIMVLSCIPSVRFCGMYNEPSDSSYFRHTTFIHLTDGKPAVIVGDLNAHIYDLVEDSDNISNDITDYFCNQNSRFLIRI